MISDDIKKTLAFIDRKMTYPKNHKIEGASANPEVVMDGKKVFMFSSNNYLGLASDKRIKEKVIEAIHMYGMGSGGSRLVSGNIDIQEELESKISDFKKTEASITLATGYMVNTGIIPALLWPPITTASGYIKEKFLLGEKVAVFSDELNHASIVDGVRLTKKVDRVKYLHKDIKNLEKEIRKRKNFDRKLIITDGVFSMDGDIAPLKQIMEIAKEYNASVMVDDAHATGILGENGRGTVEHFQLKDTPEILMGTFTKVFGGIGGFVGGDKDLIKYLKVTVRPYIFSAPIPPAIVAGIIEAIDIVKNEPERRLKLWENVNYLRDKLNKKEFNTLSSETQIIPIYIGDEQKTIRASERLLELGFFVSMVRWPAVAHGSGRLRLTVMSTHSKEQIDILIDALIKVRNEINF